MTQLIFRRADQLCTGVGTTRPGLCPCPWQIEFLDVVKSGRGGE